MVPKIQGRATSFLWYPSFPKYFHSDPAFRWALHPPPDLDLSLHFKLLHFFSQLPCFNRDKHCNSSPSFLSSIYCLNTFAKPCNPSDSAIPSSLVCLNFASLHLCIIFSPPRQTSPFFKKTQYQIANMLVISFFSYSISSTSQSFYFPQNCVFQFPNLLHDPQSSTIVSFYPPLSSMLLQYFQSS